MSLEATPPTRIDRPLRDLALPDDVPDIAELLQLSSAPTRKLLPQLLGCLSKVSMMKRD